LLAAATAVSNGQSGTITVGIVTEEAVADLSTLFDNMIGNNVVAYKVMPNAKVVNLVDVLDAGKFMDIVASDYTEYSRRGSGGTGDVGTVVVVAAEAVDNKVVIIAVVVVGVVFGFIFLIMKRRRDNNNNNNKSGNAMNTNAIATLVVSPVTPENMNLGAFGSMGEKKK
jgi:hypothetical protein